LEFLSQFHPLVVHFPIVFFYLYIFLEIANIFLKRNNFEKIMLSLLILGIIGSLVSVLTGNQAFQYLSQSSSLTQYHFYLIEKHEYHASIMIWYFLAVLILKFYFFIKKKKDTRLHYIFVIFALGGSVLLYKTAELGGVLVHKFGIGTESFK
jgi:uncharacterized membrane protein